MLSESEYRDIALADICGAHLAFRPPRRVSVSTGAAESLVIRQSGGYIGPWSDDETPYMVEPMDMLASRKHDTVVFVGPARTGKTMGLLDGWMAHNVCNDPGDMAVFQMTKDKAREYSKTRIDRAIRHSPKLKEMMSTSTQDDNTFDKLFRHGMWLRISWPTVSNMSSSDYRYVALTDYDRMPEDIGAEGTPFDLSSKRTQTYGSRGMSLAESSPGRPITDPNWKPATPHEAPPTTGILSLYNRGDRRRWFWKCPLCSEWFEAGGGLKLFNLPPEETLIDTIREIDIDALAKEHNKIYCPHCNGQFGPKLKHKLNKTGRWVADGQTLTRDDELIGEPFQSSIVSYWMGGVAAAYQSWLSLLKKYFNGLKEYALTGSELALQTTTNTDQGMPYMSKLLSNALKNAVDPEGRAEKDMQRYVVPEEARFLNATVDIQGGVNARFVVQVHAIGPHLEEWLVDRYSITESEREGMGEGKAPIDPAKYDEDWDILTERVVRATYRTPVEGMELRVRMTAVDSGGEAGATDKAYAWYRRIRRQGLTDRVMLVKGASSLDAPLIRETLVGGKKKKDCDIPLYLINPNLLKNMVDAGMKRLTPGPGYYHFPRWLPPAFFDELQSEVREATGRWKQIRKRNEALDLCAYSKAASLRLGADRIQWTPELAPVWARPLMMNSDRITTEDRREVKANTPIAQVPAEEPASKSTKRTRRVLPSSYIG